MDKTKIIEGAARLVAKGAYDKALKEYRRILDADPRDVRVLQKMGEMYQKKNDPIQAANYFTRVAENYASDGFFLKAVALYKQVLKLDPSLFDINLKLGELHQQLQLLSEATAYYHLVAQNYEKAGNTRASLDMLHKIIELDPDNVSSRIKLGELYARQNLKTEAAQEFRSAAEHLKRNSRTEEYHRVMERLSAVEPENADLAREVAQGYLAKGDAKHAIAKLQVCFQASPGDVQTLTLLGEAFQGLGQTSKTISIYRELAKIYAAQNRSDLARQTWAKIRQLDPNETSQSLAAETLAPPISAARSAPPPLPSRHTPAATPPQPEPSPKMGRNQVAQLLTETDVYVKYGLHEKALDHLNKVFASDPENLDAHEKAYRLYVAASQPRRAKEQLLNVLRLCTRLQAVERAEPYLRAIQEEDPNHPELGAFLSVLGGSIDSEAAAEPVSDDAILLEASSEDIEVEPRVGEEAESFEGGFSQEPEPEEIEQEEVNAEPPAYELALEDAEPSEPSSEMVDEPSSGESPEAAECDEAEFFLEQGLFEEARDILQTVLTTHPQSERARELLSRCESSEPLSSDADPAFDLGAELASELQTSANGGVQTGVEEDFQYSVDEVFAEFKKGLEKVVHPEDVDTHYDLGIAYKEMGLVEDAIAEFSVARQGCLGQPREINCLMMIALLQRSSGDAAGAIESYKQALLSEHAVGDMKMALEFELGASWESLGNPGKALYHYSQLLQLDSNYREVAKIVYRLGRTAKPEPDPLPGGSASTLRGNGINGAAPRRMDSIGSGDNLPKESQAEPTASQSKARKSGRV
jgi:tetratricopeptide (TPR) repeat protein